MTLRKLLILPLIASVILFAVYSQGILNDLREMLGPNYQTVVTIAVVASSVALLMAGHLLRAYKLSYLMQDVRQVPLRHQFRALSVGYLFNTLLPFRLGELIRAQIVASSQSVSFGYTLLMIIIERVVDVEILAVLAAVGVWLGLVPQISTPYIITSGIVVIVIIAGIAVLLSERQSILKLIHSITSILNDRLKVISRFKYWSVTFGAKKSVAPKRLAIFVILSIVTWGLYLSSVLTLLYALPHSTTRPQDVAAPFYAMSAPLGPANLGTYSKTYSAVVNASVTGDIKVQALSTWALLVIPMSLVGLYFLIYTKEPAWRRLDATHDIESLDDKLARNGDISNELALFLENYFAGNALSRIVNRLERSKTFRLVKYFKGGSDAITVLAKESKDLVVKKIIAIDLKDRLQAQYNWLTTYTHPKIVRAVGEQTDTDHYAINLEYDESNDMFFDYIHSNPIDESKRIMYDVWSTLRATVHAKTKLVVDTEGVQAYINKHIFGCIDQSLPVSDDLAKAILPPRIRINGKDYDNIYTIMDKIMKDKKIMKDLATYKSSGAVHGDVAIDNILVSRTTGKMLLIDPAPDGNIINGPVFDFGKNMQSLYCGYEFLFRGTEKIELSEDGGISFSDKRSLKYTQLCDYVRSTLAPKYLSPAEQKAMLFHAGALHIRRLKHQVYQDPRLTLAMYGTGVKTLNDFYQQYQ